MKFESLSVDVQNWIRTIVAEGYTAGQITDKLVQAGHDKSILNAVKQYMNDLDNSGQNVRPSSSSVLSKSPSTQKTEDRNVQILMALNSPRIILFGDLLSHDECDQLIELSKERLKPSTVINATSGNYDVSSVRTSTGACFRRGENQLLKAIEKRISQLTGCPVSHGEPIQILNYQPGAEYEPHFDYFDPKDPGNERSLQMGGQRFATVVMYLNDVEVGGATSFPQIGLDVLPRKGSAVFFSYADESGNLNPLTLHGGSPVHAGEKWIATKWLRLNEYTGPLAD